MDEKGITLIELLVTITILAVLAAIVVPLSQMSVKRQKEMELRRDLRVIRTAIDDYKKAWDEGRIKRNIGDTGYPPNLSVLVDGVEDATSTEHKKIRFLRRLPRDPMTADENLSPEETWGMRSYSSPPDDPSEGSDVFDVYAKSSESAIDGTPYKSW
ncbi:MAG: type II secretion system protein [Deltaproteobacteria bacterium]|nr:type II secretion system protein [Deltaproteobacteria bacterium]